VNRIEGAIDVLTPAGISGWLWYPDAPEISVQIELRVAGVTRATAIANNYREDVRNSGRGSGRYGFTIQIAPAANIADVEIVARTHAGEAIMSSQAPSLIAESIGSTASETSPPDIGFVDECSEYLIRGWAWDPNRPDAALQLIVDVDGVQVARIRGDLFRADLVEAGKGNGRHGFEYHSPIRLRGKRISVFSPELGQSIPIADERYDASAPAPAAPAFAGGEQSGFDPARLAEIGRIFDSHWYVAQYPEVASSGSSPLEYFIQVGAARGHAPHFLFSPDWYGRQVDLQGVFKQFPSLHYVQQGSRAGLSPHPLFHVSWYRNQHRIADNDPRTLIEHFMEEGCKTALGTTPLVDSSWYLDTYTDVKAASVNAFTHYATMGYKEGRSPNEHFDYDFYVKRYPDIQSKRSDPLAHYITLGAAELADPSPSFSTKGYIDAYPDVQRAGLNPLEHYLRSGRREGRSPRGQSAAQPTHTAKLPRFSGTEYGPIALTLPYQGYASKSSLLPKICVHLHLFHVDLAAEFAAYLNNIGAPFTLLLSIQPGEGGDWKSYFTQAVKNVAECIVKPVPNMGRDVAPWILYFAPEILSHDIFFHAHTKKSTYSDKYANWRRFLAHSSLGSTSIVDSILDQFADNPDVGLIYPPYFPALKAQPAWGGNLQKAQQLAQKLGVQAPDKCPDYPSGSFFWARVDYLRPLLNCGLTSQDFDEEAGQIDGTMAHAIERMLACLPSTDKVRKLCANVDVAFDLTHYWDRRRAQMAYPSAMGVPSPTQARSRLGGRRKIAVYTALTGGFDQFIPPLHVHDDVDYFVFTDGALPNAAPFVARPPRYADVTTRRTARFVKTNPGLYLADYDIVIWIDANVVMTSGLQPFLDTMEETNADLGVIHHSVRTSYVDEAAECARIGADDKAIIEEQVALYRSVSVPETGLIETNFMIARLDRPKVRHFYNLWWREIASHSLRDQISVNFAAYESGIKVVPLLDAGKTVRDDGRFLIFEHALDDREPALRLSGLVGA